MGIHIENFNASRFGIGRTTLIQHVQPVAKRAQTGDGSARKTLQTRGYKLRCQIEAFDRIGKIRICDDDIPLAIGNHRQRTQIAAQSHLAKGDALAPQICQIDHFYTAIRQIRKRIDRAQ